MTLGIVISCMNYNQEKAPLRWINICFQFIPQIIFLWCIFGYMCFLIIIKWCTDWTGRPGMLCLSPPCVSRLLFSHVSLLSPPSLLLSSPLLSSFVYHTKNLQQLHRQFCLSSSTCSSPLANLLVVKVLSPTSVVKYVKESGDERGEEGRERKGEREEGRERGGERGETQTDTPIAQRATPLHDHCHHLHTNNAAHQTAPPPPLPQAEHAPPQIGRARG